MDSLAAVCPVALVPAPPLKESESEHTSSFTVDSGCADLVHAAEDNAAIAANAIIVEFFI